MNAFMPPAVPIAERSRAILERLAEHEPLTTSELTLLFFGSPGRARKHLKTLLDRNLLTRVFPAASAHGGRSEALWFLSREGRRTIGAPARRAPALSIPDLEHRRAVADFFMTLIRRSLTRDDEGLWSWLGEHTCQQLFHAAVRPDGYGRYLHPGGEISFYLELDRGTETQQRLRAKLTAYQHALAADPNAQRANVLLICQQQRRLDTITHTTLTGPPWIWTSTHGEHFTPIGTENDTRDLRHLPAWPRTHRKPSDCLGKRWRTEP